MLLGIRRVPRSSPVRVVLPNVLAINPDVAEQLPIVDKLKSPRDALEGVEAIAAVMPVDISAPVALGLGLFSSLFCIQKMTFPQRARGGVDKQFHIQRVMYRPSPAAFRIHARAQLGERLL